MSDYDSAIIKMLRVLADGGDSKVEEELCVRVSHICSKKEFKRVFYCFDVLCRLRIMIIAMQ